MKIAIITTVDHNVGDDFVRKGIKYLLKQKFKNENIEFQNIHKHSPITTRYGYERFRNLRISRIVDKIIPKSWSKDRINEADIIVQSGAPVYWCHETIGSYCYDNEWYEPLIKKRFLKNKNAKLFNLAAGTCQTYHSDGTEFNEKCNDYIKEFYELSDVTTVREGLARSVFKNISIDVPVIPCSSIFAIDEHALKNEGEEYVVVNYMKGGAHYTFNQSIDFKKWENVFKKFYFQLKEKERVIISCHNQKEVDEALELDSEAKIFYEKDDYSAYMRFYSKAKFGIMNRLHGAILMASFGKPSVVIANDSRSRMLEEVGIKHYFVNEVDCEVLNREYEFLKSGANSFSERFKAIKDKAFKDYMKELAAF
tara:strand:- start:359 stop:1459 length:1101 start_codon:yes stop_codon:yes gene_type:complete